MVMNLNETQVQFLQKKVGGVFRTIDKAHEPLEVAQFVNPFNMLAKELARLVDDEGVNLAFNTEDVKTIPNVVAATAYKSKTLLSLAFKTALLQLDEEFFKEPLNNLNAVLEDKSDGDENGNNVHVNPGSGDNTDSDGFKPNGDNDGNGNDMNLTVRGLKIVKQLELYGNPIIPEFNTKGEGEYRFRATYYEKMGADGKPIISDFKLTMLAEDGKPAKKIGDLSDDGAAFLTLAVLSGLTLRPDGWNESSQTYAWGFELPYHLKWTPTCLSVEFDNLKLVS